MSEIKRTCIKISLLGDTEIGKTKICGAFFKLDFVDENITSIGIENHETKMKLENGEEIKVKIWDTAGQERFKNISINTVKTSQGVLVVFDVTKRESFKNVEAWLEKIKEKTNKVAIVLMGNKVDLPDKDRVVTKKEAEEFAQKRKIPYFESSAKLRLNIDEAFSKVVNEAYNKYGNKNGIDIKDKDNNGGGGGCFGRKKKKKKKK